MGEFEAVGDAITGGVLGRAVEPKAGELGADGHTHETSCLNCGTLLQGEFCYACGQHAHIHKTLTAFFHDFLHGFLHFEGKIWRTLPLLVWKPGELTRRYIDGERAKFVSPVALFLFSAFLMFAAVSFFGGMGEFPEQAKAGLQEELRVNRAKLAELEAQRDAAVKAGQPTSKLNEKIFEVRSEMKVIEGVQSGKIETSGLEGAQIPGWIGNGVSKAAKNPELVAYKLKTNAYKFSWLIIPLSVPFVWMLFPFSRRFRLYDHTVFVTYSLCFMSLLVVLGLFFGAVGMSTMAGLLWLLPPFHMYRQLKDSYALGRAGALWRTSFLTIFAIMVIALFSAAMVGVGTFD